MKITVFTFYSYEIYLLFQSSLLHVEHTILFQKENLQRYYLHNIPINPIDISLIKFWERIFRADKKYIKLRDLYNLVQKNARFKKPNAPFIIEIKVFLQNIIY